MLKITEEGPLSLVKAALLLGEQKPRLHTYRCVQETFAALIQIQRENRYKSIACQEGHAVLMGKQELLESKS